MAIPAKARAQADEALNEAAKALKRNLGVTRKALQAVRQAQVNLVGVTTDTEPHQGGTVHVSTNESSASPEV